MPRKFGKRQPVLWSLVKITIYLPWRKLLAFLLVKNKTKAKCIDVKRDTYNLQVFTRLSWYWTDWTKNSLVNKGLFGKDHMRSWTFPVIKLQYGKPFGEGNLSRYWYILHVSVIAYYSSKWYRLVCSLPKPSSLFSKSFLCVFGVYLWGRFLHRHRSMHWRNNNQIFVFVWRP